MNKPVTQKTGFTYLKAALMALLVPAAASWLSTAVAAPTAYPQSEDVFRAKPAGMDEPVRDIGKGRTKIRPRRATPGPGLAINPLSAVDIPSLAQTRRIRPLVLLLSFSDNAFSTTDAMNYPSFLYSDAPGPPEPDRTLAEYFDEVSGGKLSIEGDDNSVFFVDLMAAGFPSYEYYVDGVQGSGTYPQNAQGMVEDALLIADPLINYADFDNDGPDGIPSSFGSIDDDGLVDALVIIHAGPAAEYFPSPQSDSHLASRFWSFRSVPGGTAGARVHDEVDVLDWIIVPARDPEAVDHGAPWDRGTVETYQQTLGTLAHEFGHILGLPDLYDTDGSSFGLGHYGLMAYGIYGMGTFDDLVNPLQATWDRPGYPCAWSRVYLGWIQPISLHADTVFGLWRAEDDPENTLGYPQVVKVWSSSSWMPGVPWDPSEYFLMEHRQSAPGTYDLGFNGTDEGGVLIYHVDESVLMPGGNLVPTPNNNENSKGVDIEEADTGGQELDLKANFGDFTDFPTAPNDGDFFGDGSSDFWLGSVPDSRDNSAPPEPTGVTIVDGFSTYSSSAMSDYLMTVDMKSFQIVATNGIGYTGTDRAGPFIVIGGTFDDGDDDPWITAGQEVRLKLNIKHAGMPNTARGVRAQIDSPNFASVSTSSVDFGNLPALAQSTGSGEFIFTMAQPAAAFTWYSVTLQMIDDNMNFSQEILQLPVIRAAKKKGGGGGPCFIATAMWGTDHWRTNRLRVVRDKYLLKNQPGREVVDFYYKTSPPLADWLKSHPRIRTTTDFILTRLLWPFFL